MIDKKKILFLGASITQGKVSKSFIFLLKDKLGTKKYKYINHGVAGYESFNVLSKLDKAIRIMPDLVILLVGTNDVLSSLDPKLARVSRKLKHIPHEPTLSHYRDNILKIVNYLKQKTESKIALVSLPVIGENIYSIENMTIEEYNAELKKITEKEDLIYLPAYENHKSYLINKIDGKGKDYARNTIIALKSLFLHYLFFMSFDAISKKNGYLLLTDGIHLNSKGAKFIADQIEESIKKL